MCRGLFSTVTFAATVGIVLVLVEVLAAICVLAVVGGYINNHFRYAGGRPGNGLEEVFGFVAKVLFLGLAFSFVAYVLLTVAVNVAVVFIVSKG